MLKELKILNGILDLEFNEYTYEYTATVKENIKSLDFDYLLEDNAYINIRGNNLNAGENIVYIDVYNKENTITYTFYVYKENSEQVNSIDNFVNTLEIKKTESIPVYKVQILACSMFLIIIILFSIIFKKKRT